MSWESGTPTQRLRLDYSGTSVGPTTWVLVGAITDSAKIIELFDSGTKAMELGLGTAPGNASAIPMYVMPGGNGRINLNLDSGPNLYVRCIEAATTVSSGQLLINIFT